MVETILFRGNFTHRLGFKPEPMCLNVNGYPFQWIVIRAFDQTAK